MKVSKRILGARTQDSRGEMPVGEPSAMRRRTEVSVREAKDQLSALLQRAEAGEEIVITSDGEPKAMLVRFRPTPAGKPWRSQAAFRATLPMTGESTEALDESRADRRPMTPRKKSKMVGVAEAGAAYDVVARRGVSVRVAKDQLSGLLERAARGEEIVITSDGVPKAVLVRYRPRLHSKPFTPDTDWLRAMPLLADSTSEIRAERDSQP